MRNRNLMLIASLLLVLGIVLLGCSADDAESSTESEDASETVAASTEETIAVEDDAATEAAAEPDEPEEAVEAAAAGPDLGPTDAYVSWAYLEDMYQQNGYWYVTVDYIQVAGPEDDLQFINQNPKLRTFPIAQNANLQLLRGNGGSPDYNSVTPAQFDAFQEQSGEEIVEVTPANGQVTKLTEWWSP